MELDKKKKQYGKEYTQHLFEQYKLYLSGIEKISDRRENANKYFVAINSVIILAGTFLIDHVKNIRELIFLLYGILILGIVICIIFWFLINSYKQLNTAKFELLHKIEKELPLQLYSKEWEILGKGANPKKYLPFSHIEKIIPFVFGIFYFIGIIYLLVNVN